MRLYSTNNSSYFNEYGIYLSDISSSKLEINKMKAGSKMKWEDLGGVVSISQSNRYNVISVYINCEGMEMIGEKKIIFDQKEMSIKLPSIDKEPTNTISSYRGFQCAAKYQNAAEMKGEYLIEKVKDVFFLTRIIEKDN